jgi:hypothetical protein
MTGGNSKCGYRVSESLCKEGGVPFLVLGWWGVQPVDNYKNRGETSQIGKELSSAAEVFTLTGE